MKSVFIATGIVIGVGLVLLLLTGMPLEILGYGLNVNPDQFAEEIVKNNGSANECFKLIWVDIFPRLPTAVYRRECIYQVAQLKKDSSICATLLPDEYGLDCIATIWGKETDKQNCHWIDTNAVRCFEGEKLVQKNFICDPALKNLPDECWHRIAFSKKETLDCMNIHNSILLSVCQERIRAWIKYPEIHNSLFFGKQQ